jgi:hypothetical protein
LGADGTNKVSGGAAIVSLAATSGITLTSYDVAAGAPVQNDVPLQGSTSPWTVQLTGISGTSLTLAVHTTEKGASGPAGSATCKANNVIDTAKRAPPPGAQPGVDPSRDLLATAWWLSYGAAAREALRKEGGKDGGGFPHDTQFLVHLPSGAPAFPFPSSVREGTPLQVAVIVPVGQTSPIDIAVTSCADIQTFRLKPSDNGEGKQSAAVPDESRGPALGAAVLVPVGATFKCGAGTASYTLKFGASDTGTSSTTSLRIRSVYHFAATFVLGYDTAPTRTFGTSAQGAAQSVTELDNNVGLGAYIGGVWMVGGVDYEDMKPWNWFLNPFIAVNPTSPTKDAVAGLALSPTGGVSLAVGVSLHEGTALNGYSVGDPFTGSGTVPTRDTWAAMKPGFFIGAAVDSNVYNAVKALGGTK